MTDLIKKLKKWRNKGASAETERLQCNLGRIISAVCEGKEEKAGCKSQK